MKNPYEELEDRFKRMDALNGALSMLYWDMSAPVSRVSSPL